jgi:hypothetical protein
MFLVSLSQVISWAHKVAIIILSNAIETLRNPRKLCMRHLTASGAALQSDASLASKVSRRDVRTGSLP